MVTDELDSLIMNQIRGIIILLAIPVSFENHLCVIVPEIVWKITVGVSLTVVSIEVIDPVGFRVTIGSRVPKSPFSEHSGNIVLLVEKVEQGPMLAGHRILPLGFHFLVVSDRTMSSMKTGKKR
jgi:hypothetical protein